VNVAAWGAVIVLGTAALLVPAVLRQINLGLFRGGAQWIEWIGGVLAVLLGIGAGLAARRTVLVDAMRLLNDLHPLAPYIVLGVLLIAMAFGLLSLLPGPVSSRPITTGVVVAAILLPSLVVTLRPVHVDFGQALHDAVTWIGDQPGTLGSKTK
jgi:hypothetical protein